MKHAAKSISLFLALFLALAGAWAAPRSGRPGDPLLLDRGGEATVTPPGLRVRVDEVEPGKGAHLTVVEGTSTHGARVEVGGEVAVGEYVVQLVRATRTCQVVVWYRPSAGHARDLISANGWHPDGTPPSRSTLDVPASLSGLPFSHYQMASEAAGLDLSPAAGRQLTLQRWRVREKTSRGAAIYVFLGILDNRILGAWVGTEAPIAPGIAPINSRSPVRW